MKCFHKFLLLAIVNFNHHKNKELQILGNNRNKKSLIFLALNQVVQNQKN